MLKQPYSLHYILLILWTILNLVQSGLTELAHDEAYAWMYSNNPDWGHFHQPPLIGPLIWAGYQLIQSEIGVRLITVILSTISLHLIFLMTDRKNIWLFWAIIGGTFLIHMGGFMAIPDSPLIFLAVLFLWVIRKYVKSYSWFYAITLGCLIALMAYSKYHAILLIAFTLIANITALKKWTAYLIPVTALLLLIPHINWLISHSAGGWEYHLSGRFGENFQWRYILGYPLGQLAVTGPLIGAITLFAAFRYKPQNNFERTLKINLIGIFGFFIFWSFRGNVEANWTALALIPLIILSYQYLQQHQALRKWLYILAIPSICLMLLLRAHLAQQIFTLPLKYDKTNEFYGWKDFSDRVKTAAAGLPVLTSSYQLSSKLSFYMKEDVPMLNVSATPADYDYWELDKKHFGKSVMLLNTYWMENATKVKAPSGKVFYLGKIDNYRSYLKVKIEVLSQVDVFSPGSVVMLKTKISNPYPYAITMHDNSPYPVYLSYSISSNDTFVVNDWPKNDLTNNIEREGEQSIRVNIPEKKGSYDLKVFLVSDGLIAWPVKEHYPFEVQ